MPERVFSPRLPLGPDKYRTDQQTTVEHSSKFSFQTGAGRQESWVAAQPPFGDIPSKTQVGKRAERSQCPAIRIKAPAEEQRLQARIGIHSS